jgi:hypothetical protein
MQSIARIVLFVAISLAVAAPVLPAYAQVQDGEQQKCLTSGFRTGNRLGLSLLGDASNCLNLSNKGSLPPAAPTAQLCLAADLKGKVAKAQAKTSATFTKNCGNTPDFAFTDATTLSDAYRDESSATTSDFFGVDLDTALTSGAPSDPKASCAGGLMKMLGKVESTVLKDLGRCIKVGLKDESIIDGPTFTACLAIVKTDIRGRLSKATAKTLKTLNSKCPGGDLGAIFPGAVSVCAAYSLPTSTAGMSECVGSRELCRVCRIVNGAHGLSDDCDAFDDGVGNGSCPS